MLSLVMLHSHYYTLCLILIVVDTYIYTPILPKTEWVIFVILTILKNYCPYRASFLDIAFEIDMYTGFMKINIVFVFDTHKTPLLQNTTPASTTIDLSYNNRIAQALTCIVPIDYRSLKKTLSYKRHQCFRISAHSTNIKFNEYYSHDDNQTSG